MCRPERMIRGTSSRPSSHRVSLGTPASRTSNVPALASARACANAVCSSTAPWSLKPMWQCTSTNPGSAQPSMTCATSSPGALAPLPSTKRPSWMPTWGRLLSAPVMTSPRTIRSILPPTVASAEAATAAPHRPRRGPSAVQELLEPRRQFHRLRIDLIGLVAHAEGGTGPGLGALRGLALLACPFGRVPGLALLALLRRSLHPATGLLAGTRHATHARHPGGPRHPGHPGGTPASHGPHHRLGLVEPLHHLVDLGDGGTRTLGDPGAAGTIENFGVGALGRRHRLHDRLHPDHIPLVEVLQLLAHLAHSGQHAEHLLHRPELLHLLHLGEEVIQGELAVTADLLGEFGGLLLIEGFLGLLDEGEHITHVQDAGGHPVRVETFEVGEFLPGGGEQHRLTGHRADGQRRTAAGIAVEFGQYHPGEADSFGEGLGGADRILADHRIDDEEGLIRLHRITDIGRLGHHFLVHTGAAVHV